jgi:nitrate reductase (NAD(P)H)
MTEYAPGIVRTHNTAADCWLIIHNKVYDVSSYLSSHPGGADILLSCAGKNASLEFDDIGHSKSAVQTLAKYEIGVCLSPPPPPSAPSEPSLFSSIIGWLFPKRTILLTDPNKMETATLLSRTQITHDTVSLLFAIPIEMSLGIACGQHIVCHAGGTNRKYTPITDTRGSFELLVKIYETGVVSPYLGNLKIGDAMAISGPAGRNLYLGNGRFSVAGREIQSHNLLMICAGSGITPIFAVLRKIVLNDEYNVRANLLFVNKTSDDIILHEEIDQMCFEHANVSVQYSLTQKNSGWSGLVGRPSPNMIANIAKHDFSGIVLICGSSEFNSGISRICCNLGFAKSNIITF